MGSLRFRTLVFIQRELDRYIRNYRERAAKELKDSRTLCLVCRGQTDWYMLKNDVWHQATAGLKAELGNDGKPHKNLCLPCVEHCLGRELEFSDFSPAPINHAILWALGK